MLYLSQLLGKTIYFEGKPYGKLVDMAVFENRPNPPVSKIEIKQQKQKVTIAPDALLLKDNKLVLTTQHVPQLPYDHKDFYLAEDLLDKQVIDTDGKRLVRVNDIVLETGAEMKVAGIDVGFDGVLRRLGLPFLTVDKKVLPWSTIEALDYDTGTVRLKVKQKALSSLHPAEVADILEDAGTKERLGIIASMDAKQAARALEEADTETQVSILEGLTPAAFKDIINKMHVSELADVFHDLNPVRAQELQHILGTERASQVKRLSAFQDDVAGGLMREKFISFPKDITLKEIQATFFESKKIPETVVVIDKEGKLIGTIQTKDFFQYNSLAMIGDVLQERKFVHTQAPLEEIIRVFAQYNLRSLPVVDKERKPIGIIVIDDLLSLVEEENEKNDNL